MGIYKQLLEICVRLFFFPISLYLINFHLLNKEDFFKYWIFFYLTRKSIFYPLSSTVKPDSLLHLTFCNLTYIYYTIDMFHQATDSDSDSDLDITGWLSKLVGRVRFTKVKKDHLNNCHTIKTVYIPLHWLQHSVP